MNGQPVKVDDPHSEPLPEALSRIPGILIKGFVSGAIQLGLLGAFLGALIGGIANAADGLEIAFRSLFQGMIWGASLCGLLGGISFAGIRSLCYLQELRVLRNPQVSLQSPGLPSTSKLSRAKHWIVLCVSTCILVLILWVGYYLALTPAPPGPGQLRNEMIEGNKKTLERLGVPLPDVHMPGIPKEEPR